jgi:HlyD family secretion protein
MDRIINPAGASKKKKLYLTLSLLTVLVVATGAYGLSTVLQSKVKLREIETATAEIGSIENTISALGEVQPEYEEVITSPITATIRQVYLNEGSKVEVGKSILRLNTDEMHLEYEKQKDQLELEKKGIEKLKLERDRIAYDLKVVQAVHAYRITELLDEIEYAEKLSQVGGGTADDVRKLQNQLKVARLEQQQALFNTKNEFATVQASIQEAEISEKIQESALAEFQRKLAMAEDVKAGREGVITLLNRDPGTQVTEGEVLIKFADLSSYKVTGTISDTYAPEVFLGMKAIVRANNQNLTGKVSSINPSIQNNVLTFQIALDAPSSQGLRPKLRVEVSLVTEKRDSIIRVANGPAFNGPKDLDVFVLSADNTARKRRIQVGFKNKHYVQILKGVTPGEQVVTAGLEGYTEMSHVVIQP